MLRRVGAFAAPRNTSHLIPERNDSDAVNNSKWKKWVERESFKRYGICKLDRIQALTPQTGFTLVHA
jgi:hypothetical protein